MKHPVQKVELVNGVLRFRRNKIVEALLNTGNLSMKDIAFLDFPRADREQFAYLLLSP